MGAADADTGSLPNDSAALRAVLAEAPASCRALEVQNDRLRYLPPNLKSLQFGCKPERLAL